MAKTTRESKGDPDRAAATAAPGSPEAIGELLDSPCKNRGDSLNFTLRARVGDRIQLRFQLCESPGELKVFLEETSPTAPPGRPIVSQVIESSEPLVAELIDLPAGTYIALFKWNAFAEAWHAKAEALINGIARFRRYQSTDDEIPSNKIYVVITVVP